MHVKHVKIREFFENRGEICKSREEIIILAKQGENILKQGKYREN